MPKWLVFVGDASYSLYLSHLIAMPAIARALIAVGLGKRMPPDFLLTIVVVGCIIVGCISYLMIEKPLLRGLAPRRTVHSGIVSASRTA